MKTVYKYEVSSDDIFSLSLPIGAEVLSVQSQYGNPYMWVLVDPNQQIFETRFFRLAGTGHPIKCPIKNFIGTFQLEGGSLVFHLFEAK